MEGSMSNSSREYADLLQHDRGSGITLLQHMDALERRLLCHEVLERPRHRDENKENKRPPVKSPKDDDEEDGSSMELESSNSITTWTGYEALEREKPLLKWASSYVEKVRSVVLQSCRTCTGPITRNDGRVQRLVYTLGMERCKSMRMVEKGKEAGTIRASLLAYAIHTLLVENMIQVRAAPWHGEDRHVDYESYVEVFVLKWHESKKVICTVALGDSAARCIWEELDEQRLRCSKDNKTETFRGRAFDRRM